MSSKLALKIDASLCDPQMELQVLYAVTIPLEFSTVEGI